MKNDMKMHARNEVGNELSVAMHLGEKRVLGIEAKGMRGM